MFTQENGQLRRTICITVALVTISPAAFALSSSGDTASANTTSSSSKAAPVTRPFPPAVAALKYDPAPAPFSQFALSLGLGAGGFNLQAATNVNHYVNLRLTGNTYSYTVSNLSTNGLTLNGKLNLASSGLSVDVYPFPYNGLRFSPGIFFYNGNSANAAVSVAGANSFSLNHATYYSSSSAPVQGTASLGFNARNPAFTMTTGWGNLISRVRGRFSIPFEFGAAFVGAPMANLALNSGQVCTYRHDTSSCQNVATDQRLQSNLQVQLAKFQNAVNPLKAYPIISVGIGYSFKIRQHSHGPS
jgi:hypothetical protein